MLPWACCALAYGREFLEKNRLRFYPGIYHEDVLFNAWVACVSKTFLFLDVCLYNHRQHGNSTMGRADGQHVRKRISDMCIVLFQLQLLKERFRGDAVRAKYIERVSGCVAMDLTDMLAFSDCSSKTRKEVVKKLKGVHLYPLSYGSSNVRYRFYRGLMSLHLPFFCIRWIYRIFPFKHPFWNGLTIIGRFIKKGCQKF